MTDSLHLHYIQQWPLWSMSDKYSSSSRWRYSPEWAFAYSTICLQASRFLALSLHSFTPIFLRSMVTSYSLLIFGLPLRLVAYSFPYNIFLRLRCLAIFLYDQAIVLPSFSIIWNFITVFTIAHFSLSGAKWIQFTPCHSVSNICFNTALPPTPARTSDDVVVSKCVWSVRGGQSDPFVWIFTTYLRCIKRSRK